MEDLEVLSEVLTQDALNLKPGGPVALQAQDGEPTFPGTIQSLEPAGFTKPSSLGVEQQRVDVVVRPHSAPPRLGVGYRVQATFVTETRKGALLIPRPSLMRTATGEAYVLLCQDGTLHQQAVRPGLMGDARIEILEGLQDGDSLVATPDSTLRDGMKVKPVLVQPRP